MSAISPSDLTRSALLAFIGRHGPTSRAELARSLAVSSALITQISKKLIAQGLIEEVAAEASSGGRPAQLLDLVNEAGCAIGIKVAEDHLTMVEVALDGRVIRSSSEPFAARSATALRDMVCLLKRFIEERPGSSPLLGVGVGVPGSVNDQAVGIVDSTQIGWSQVPLGDYIRNEVNLPVLVENNVNALAVAEHLYGQAQGKSDALILTVGTGVGAGIVTDGVVVRGAAGAAGEIGHFRVSNGEELCQCGNRGCLEALVGEEGLLRTARERGLIGPEAKIDALIAEADRGNDRAQQIFSEAGHLLGGVVAGAINLLNPSVVVISGEGAAAWEHWSYGFEPTLRATLFPKMKGTPISVERWQDDRWAQGAASIVLASPFDTEGITGRQGQLVRQRLIETAEGESGVTGPTEVRV